MEHHTISLCREEGKGEEEGNKGGKGEEVSMSGSRRLFLHTSAVGICRAWFPTPFFLSLIFCCLFALLFFICSMFVFERGLNCEAVAGLELKLTALKPRLA